jgi:hypothetical protein
MVDGKQITYIFKKDENKLKIMSMTEKEKIQDLFNRVSQEIKETSKEDLIKELEQIEEEDKNIPDCSSDKF